MLKRLFPEHLTNNYRGKPIARLIFVALTIVTVARSFVHIFAPDGGAQSIATIPLDRFTDNGAATVVLLFGLWGVSQLLLGIVDIVVLWRYQALIPFMYALMLIEYGARLGLGIVRPIETVGTAPGGVGNYVLVPLAAVMLALSLGESATTRTDS